MPTLSGRQGTGRGAKKGAEMRPRDMHVAVIRVLLFFAALFVAVGLVGPYEPGGDFVRRPAAYFEWGLVLALTAGVIRLRSWGHESTPE
jgi:hypothetical protein